MSCDLALIITKPPYLFVPAACPIAALPCPSRRQGAEGRSSSLPIVQLATAASIAALRSVARDRLRRLLTRRSLPRYLAPARTTDQTRTRFLVTDGIEARVQWRLT